MRHKAKWLDYCDSMLDPASTVRHAAAFVGVHKNTSFRWRHRLLTWVRHDRQLPLRGIVEADEMFFLESEKGARRLSRAPRRRGGVAGKRGISGQQVCVLVARDRGGRTFDAVTGKGPLTQMQLQRHLGPVLDGDYTDTGNKSLLPTYFIAVIDGDKLRFMDRQTGLSPPQTESDAQPQRRNTMNASKLFAAVAAVAFAGSAVAADLPVANASISAAAAAAQVSVAAKSLNVPAILVDKSAGPTRAQIRAEAVEAAKNHRATEVSQFDWYNN